MINELNWSGYKPIPDFVEAEILFYHLYYGWNSLLKMNVFNMHVTFDLYWHEERCLDRLREQL